jgi:hypothetical protein
MGPDAFAVFLWTQRKMNPAVSKPNNKSVAVKLLQAIPKDSLDHSPFGATPHPIISRVLKKC